MLCQIQRICTECQCRHTYSFFSLALCLMCEICMWLKCVTELHACMCYGFNIMVFMICTMGMWISQWVDPRKKPVHCIPVRGSNRRQNIHGGIIVYYGMGSTHKCNKHPLQQTILSRLVPKHNSFWIVD
jgi:hypothetical protein